MSFTNIKESFTNIKEIVQEFCEAGAEAVRCYAEVSQLDPLEAPYMPEYFASAFILQKLGRSRRIILEASLTQLQVWNDDACERRHLLKLTEPETLLRLKSLNEALGRRSPRVDLTLFDSKRDLLALVEVKPGWISFESAPARISDRDKLLHILPLVHTCPYGIACGWMELNHLKWQRSRKNGDILYEAKVQHIPGVFNSSHEYFFGARVFPNPTAPGAAIYQS
jgi:hypothetical protein